MIKLGVHHGPAVQQVLQSFPTPVPFTAVLKGIEGAVTLYRLTLAAPP